MQNSHYFPIYSEASAVETGSHRTASSAKKSERQAAWSKLATATGVLIGFESEEDWFEYRFEHDPRFLRRIEQARNSLRAGRGIRLEDLETE